MSNKLKNIIEKIKKYDELYEEYIDSKECGFVEEAEKIDNMIDELAEYLDEIIETLTESEKKEVEKVTGEKLA